MKSISLARALLIVTPIIAPLGAHAKPSEGDRASISLGVFITDRDTKTRLDSDLGLGTEIVLEDDLGLDSSDNVFRIDGYFRFSDRHRLDFSAFDLSRDTVATIDRDITWGEETYAVNTVVETDFDLAIYKGAYTYSIVDYERGYIGASIGLYVADITVSLDEQNVGRFEEGSVTAPLPVVGLRGSHEISDRWSVKGSAELFALEIDDTDGSLVDALVGIDYAISDNFSIGAGYNYVNIDVDSEDSGLSGSLDWEYKGGMLYLQARY